ncbi:non-ribosomal peptide synthetase [Pseudoalteromonas sp. B62]|uniref:non-ribosomal peptide synthetase n=1 Tax=Pseudoalteromonas sp. B62 TaxID=630483 RepID=UPI00301C0089
MTTKHFPLSQTQQDIYFDQLHYPDNPLYNIGGYVRFGRVDVDKLTKAHQILVMRHDAFGIRIIADDEGIRQTISNERTLTLSVHDFSTLPNPLESAEQWLTELFEAPLEIENKELFKAFVLKIADDEYRYICFGHHLCMDGWGFANWIKQLGGLYNDDDTVITEQIPWETIIDEDLRYLDSKKFQKDKSYWAEYCRELPDSLLQAQHIYKIKNPKKVPSAREVLDLTTYQIAAVAGFAKQYGIGVNQVYLNIFVIYFSQFYKSRKLVFGVPVHNRKGHSQKEMIGVFTSVSPLLLDVDDQRSFVDISREIFSQQKKNYRHQHYSIGHLNNDLKLPPGSDSVYDVAFNYLQLENDLVIEGRQTQLAYLSNNHDTTPISITVWASETNNTAEIQFDYNFAYFDSADIALIKARTNHLIDTLLSNAETPIHQIQLLPESEQKQLLDYSVNDKQVDSSQNQQFYHQFEQAVAYRPDSIAIVAQDRQISYRELNQSANQLAAYIKEQGLTAGDRVGVCINRSWYGVLALLATLKAGGCFVPLDPDYPEQRLSFMLKDSAPALLISEAKLVDSLAFDPRKIICIENIMEDIEQYSSANTELKTVDSDPAYIIYTSGSTGQPKGVVVSHRAMANYCDVIKNDYQVNKDDRVLQFSSLSFDIFIEEVCASLAVGAALVVSSEGIMAGREQFVGQLIESRLSVITLPTAFWHGLCADKAELEKLNNSDLRLVILGGEAMSFKALQKWKQVVDRKVRLLNTYGPTEATVVASVFDTADYKGQNQQVPIGRPASGSQLFVLDDNRGEVAVGHVGELYIGGQRLAEGYHNLADMTDEKFITTDAGDRLYQTGDMVRWLPDGNLEFVGRVDYQIKLRGFRIELPEIEAAILACEQVSECLVLLNDEPKQLVAYVVAQNTAELTVQLQQQLAQKLPGYMIPSVYVVLDAMPLTTAGKVDRKALPQPDKADQFGRYLAPQSNMEKTLCQIWQDVLGLQQVGINDNFFSIGGDSIMTLQVISSARAQGVQITARQVFEFNTIAELAMQAITKKLKQSFKATAWASKFCCQSCSSG